MAKDIIMRVLTSAGYEPMYPFNPSLSLNATFESGSTNALYKLSIKGLESPFTEAIGNKTGIITFVPTIANATGVKISINGGAEIPLVFNDGGVVSTNMLVANQVTSIKYYKNKFYLLISKNQIGLNNVENTSDINKPVSLATQRALDKKLNVPIRIPKNSNLNNYRTAGLYYNPLDAETKTIANVPTGFAFSLFIEEHAGAKQTLTAYLPAGIQMWVRNYYNGTWGSWYRVAIVLHGSSAPNPGLGVDGNIYLKTS